MICGRVTSGEAKSRDAVEVRKNMQRYKKNDWGRGKALQNQDFVISFELPKITLEVSWW